MLEVAKRKELMLSKLINHNIIVTKGYKMFTKCPNKMLFCLFFCALLTNISIATNRQSTPASADRPCCSVEKNLLGLLGLGDDATDAEIVQLLDIPEKQIFAMILVSYGRISSATPKLLQIVEDSNTLLPAKMAAADTLCDFGNREWVPTLKPLLLDPNSSVARTHLRIKVAGLLARAGDYSQFETVAAAIGDKRKWVRGMVVTALGNFRHKTEPVTDLAARLLVSLAIADPSPRLRERAIYSLEKIAKVRPEATSYVIACLQANLDSPDKMLRTICKGMLVMYDRESRMQ